MVLCEVNPQGNRRFSLTKGHASWSWRHDVMASGHWSRLKDEDKSKLLYVSDVPVLFLAEATLMLPTIYLLCVI